MSPYVQVSSMVYQKLHNFKKTFTSSIVKRSAPPGILDIRGGSMVQKAGDHLGVVVEACHMEASDAVLTLVTHFVSLLQ